MRVLRRHCFAPSSPIWRATAVARRATKTSQRITSRNHGKDSYVFTSFFRECIRRTSGEWLWGRGCNFEIVGLVQSRWSEHRMHLFEKTMLLLAGSRRAQGDDPLCRARPRSRNPSAVQLLKDLFSCVCERSFGRSHSPPRARPKVAKLAKARETIDNNCFCYGSIPAAAK